MVAQDGAHIGVAREHPGPEQPAAVHRSPVAQGRINGIGILDRPRRERVVGHSAAPALGQDHRAGDRGSYRFAN